MPPDSLNTVEDTFAFFVTRVHFWFTYSLSTRTPRSFSAKLLSSFSAKPLSRLLPSLYWCVRLFLHSAAISHCEIPVSAFLLPVEVSLNGSTNVSCSFQFCIIYRPVEGVFLSRHLVINKAGDRFCTSIDP